jgi:hypothetical protein
VADPVTMMMIGSTALSGASAAMQYSSTRSAGRANLLAAQNEAEQIRQAAAERMAAGTHASARLMEQGRRNLSTILARTASRGGDPADPTARALAARERQTSETDSLLTIYEGLVGERNAAVQREAMLRGAQYERRMSNYRATSQLVGDIASTGMSWATKYGSPGSGAAKKSGGSFLPKASTTETLTRKISSLST